MMALLIARVPTNSRLQQRRRQGEGRWCQSLHASAPQAAITAESANAPEGYCWTAGAYAALAGAAIAILFGGWYAKRRGVQQ